ncbi:MAG: glycosyltransferase [Bacteroidales bacterium]|nr:glycosyltransferase [Bacteroidales bacterium]
MFIFRAIIFAYYTRYKLLHTRYYKQKHIQTQKSIVYINTSNTQGGAARIAYDLHMFQLSLSNQSQMLVSNKQGTEAEIYELKQDASKKQQLLYEAQKWLQWQDFFHLASLQLYKHPAIQQASIVHAHNLHSWNGFFSPFALPELCSRKQVIWTLHDMHAVTGHCASSFKCEKWKIGCGNCPQLETYPKLTKDTTSFIWKTKKNIYKRCDMHIVVPSKWLQDIVSQSILSHLPCTLIYNGIDTSIYKPYNKQEVRTKFELPSGKTIILFSADLGIANPFKGGEYIQQLIERYKTIPEILFVNIGGGTSIEKSDLIWNVPYIQDQTEMAEWYSAADMYVYPSLADNCPLVVLEAMACGLPIVTFNTGGIPELVLHNQTGYVANYKDFDDLCKGFNFIRNNIEIRKSMVEKSIERVQKCFTLDIMNEQYYNLYKKLV